MKIIDWIHGKRLNFETLEIEERDDVVVIPAWQFALFVRKYKERGCSLVIYAVILLFLIGYIMLGSVLGWTM